MISIQPDGVGFIWLIKWKLFIIRELNKNLIPSISNTLRDLSDKSFISASLINS